MKNCLNFTSLLFWGINDVGNENNNQTCSLGYHREVLENETGDFFLEISSLDKEIF